MASVPNGMASRPNRMSSGLKPMKLGPLFMGFAPYLMTIGLKGMDPKAGSMRPTTKLFSPTTEGMSPETEGMPLGKGGSRRCIMACFHAAGLPTEGRVLRAQAHAAAGRDPSEVILRAALADTLRGLKADPVGA